ncbi:MAG: carbohydrate binding domain-containing protein, partial [Bacteroidetes bacterium]|nr:carbohydrate binding domain-containing protein [Bacteroidota bacterium]
MKHFYVTIFSIIALSLSEFAIAQTGPNLLGAKGTFSTPFITVNTGADACTSSGSNSFNPIGNIGNALGAIGGGGTDSLIPTSAYDYTASADGLSPEFTYTIIKVIGDASGGNCMKPEWRGQDHTGDGGYFMAVNGAPNDTKSPVFYQIKTVPVCAGTKYEFSAWVLNILPASHPAAQPGSEPNISLKVISAGDTQIVASSGPIAYNNSATWVKVNGTYTAPATASVVDVQIINATSVAQGNDLGLDDISFAVLEPNVTITNQPLAPICEGANFNVNFKVTDNSQTNVWYKWQLSKDGGATFVDSSLGAQQATFTGDNYTLTQPFNNVTADMNGYKYRLVASTSSAGLSTPSCTYVNEFTL